MNDYERIQAIMDYYRISSAKDFAVRLGMKHAQPIYDIKAGKCKISSKLEKLILEEFREISRVWLVTGEGEMIKPIDSSANVQFGDITGFKQSGTGNTAFSPGTATGQASEIEHLRREIEGLNAQIVRLEKELDGKQSIIEALLKK